MNDRIKIAEAIGQDPGILCTWSGAESFIFDPFTDANDDYAVAVHFLSLKDSEAISAFKDALWAVITKRTGHQRAFPWDYILGDNAMAALKVLQ